MHYKCLLKKSYQINNLTVKAINEDDIESIRKIRNDQIDILRQQKLITKADQKKYFQNNIWNDMAITQKNILLAIFKEDFLIGYGGLVHISWQDKRAELSFIIEKKFSDIEKEKIMKIFISQIKKIFFDELKMHKISTETYSFRDKHIKTLELCGFIKEGVLTEHIYINNKYFDSILHGCFK